jgi:hypothetical protein
MEEGARERGNSEKDSGYPPSDGQVTSDVSGINLITEFFNH